MHKSLPLVHPEHIASLGVTRRPRNLRYFVTPHRMGTYQFANPNRLGASTVGLKYVLWCRKARVPDHYAVVVPGSPAEIIMQSMPRAMPTRP